jgi:hypothetical protein
MKATKVIQLKDAFIGEGDKFTGVENTIAIFAAQTGKPMFLKAPSHQDMIEWITALQVCKFLIFISFLFLFYFFFICCIHMI